MKNCLASAVSLFALTAFVGAGCDVPEQDLVSPFDEWQYDEAWLDEVVTGQRIELTPDGVGRVERVEVTRREQLRAARLEQDTSTREDGLGVAEQAVSVSSSFCGTYDFKVWSDTYYNGHFLCFYGTAGFVVLDDYSFCSGGTCTRWGGQIESFKSGNDYGTFTQSDVCRPSVSYDPVGVNESDPTYYPAPNLWEGFHFNQACPP